MTDPTTIIWITLPRNGNGGAAIVKWRQEDRDIGYLLGDKPAHYPVPDTYDLNCKPARYLFVGAWFIDWSRGVLEFY